MLKKTATAIALTAALCCLSLSADAKPKKPVDGPTAFDENCSKCHYITGVAGFDVVDSGKKDLRQALSDPALIEDRITNGIKKGTAEMPAFKYKSKFMKEGFPVLLEWLTSQK